MQINDKAFSIHRRETAFKKIIAFLAKTQQKLFEGQKSNLFLTSNC